MIVSFADEETKKIFQGQTSRKLPPNIQRTARRKLLYLDDADDLRDLLAPPGNRLEQLKGDRIGQYSIRINDQWRICFRWQEDHALDGIERKRDGGVGRAADESEAGAFLAALGGELDDAIGGLDDGAGVSGAGVAEGVRCEIDESVECGGEHGGAGAFENGGESVIEAVQEFTGIGGLRALFF